MNKMKRKRRIKTLIFAILIAGITVFNFIISVKKLLLYDELCFTTRNYKAYGNLRGIYTLSFVFFLLISTYLIYMICRYRGRLYDKWFRSYSVIGVIDNTELKENFVKVVFERKNKYYVQDDCYESTGNSRIIKRFNHLPDEEIKKIIPLKEFNTSYLPTVIVGDKIISAFRYDDNIIIDTSDEVNKTLSEYGYDNIFEIEFL